jgi:predicted type IV restriction endonuclease
MALLESLKIIISNLERGGYPNEQSVTQGIVLRILSCLGWDQFDPEQVWPEYSVPPQRVDLALCHPSKKPIVFIEVPAIFN